MATATSKLQIIIDVLGGKSTKLTLTDIKSGIDMVGSALNKMGQYAQAAYAAIKEGAQIELAQIRFERLAASIGTTADALMDQLGPAVGGMMSQADQMKLAGDLMSLGLAKTTDEAVRLTGVAAQLGMNMNQLVLTLTNQTTMRFDALGVAVDGFDAKVKALEQQGYSTDEAFKWAFIQQAEDQIKRVGSVADTTAGQLMILEAGMKDLTDSMKQDAAEGIAPFVTALNTMREATDAGVLPFLVYYKQFFEAIGSQKRAAEITAIWSEKLNQQNSILNDAAMRSRSYATAVGVVAAVSWDSYHATNQSASVLDFYATRADNAAQSAYNYGQTLVPATAAQEDLNAALSIAGGSYSSLSTSVSATTTALQEQIDFIQAGGGVVAALIAAANEALDAGDWDLAQSLADEASIAATDVELELDKISAEDAATKISNDLGIGFDEAEQMVADLQASIFAMTSKSYIIRFGLDVPGGDPGQHTGSGKGSTGGSGGGGSQIGKPDAGQFSIGFPSGGGPTIIIDNLVVVTDSAYDLVSQLTTMQARSALGAVAGSGYAGT